MTSIQLPTLPASIVTNIWEDTIKCDADMVLRNVHKKNYDKVVEQIKHIVPIGKANALHLLEDFQDMQLPDDWYLFVHDDDELPMIIEHTERLNDYDGLYEFCYITPYNLEWTDESPRIHNPSDYDYSETDSMTKDLELLRSRASIALQNLSTEIQKKDEVDALYKKLCYKNTLIYIGLLRSCLSLDNTLYNTTYQITRKMYGEKAFDLIDTQIAIEDDDWEDYEDEFFD